MQQLKKPSSFVPKPVAPQNVLEKQKLATEVSRYDYLKKTAEKLMKSQVSSRAEVTSMETKLQRQESVIMTQASSLEKLREEKAKLQSILQGEKQQYERLKFDVVALTTISSSLKKEVASFAVDLVQAGRDKEELVKENGTLREVRKRLEAELQSSTDDKNGARFQLAQAEALVAEQNANIKTLECQYKEVREQLDVERSTSESLRAELFNGREELKKTINELCSVRAECSSLDERCTVLQILERDLNSTLREKEAAWNQSALEAKSINREKSVKINELEGHLQALTQRLSELQMTFETTSAEKSSIEELNARMTREKVSANEELCAMKARNESLAERLSSVEAAYGEAIEKHKAMVDSYEEKVMEQEQQQSQQLDKVVRECNEKLLKIQTDAEKKSQEVGELQSMLEAQRREFSNALATELQKQQDLYQAQIAQLNNQLVESAATIEQLRAPRTDTAPEVKAPEEDVESDEVLSGSITIVNVPRTREVPPKKKSPPPPHSNTKHKKVNKPVAAEHKRYLSTAPSAKHDKKVRAPLASAAHVQPQPSSRVKPKKKSKKTLDLFDDVFAFNG